MLKMVKDVLAAEASAILNIPESNPFAACVELFLESRKQGGKLVISGVGKAGEIGKKMAVTFCSVGLPSVFLHPLEAQHGDLGLLNAHDVLLLISNSGQTREVVELEILAKRLIPTLKVVALTGKNASQLAQVADYVLWTGDPKEACPLGLTPTTSTTAMTVIGDVLAVMLVQISGYKAEDYAKRHHSGYLGDAARQQTTEAVTAQADAAELRHIYESLHRENPDFQTNNWLLDELSYLTTLPIDSLVEIGCGNGRFSLAAASKFQSVTAIDWVKSPVTQSATLPANLSYVIGDALSMPIAESSAVVSADFFEHLRETDVSALIAKISGIAPIQFHKIACYPDSRGLHLTLWSPEAWLAAFQAVDSGFAILKTEQRRNREDQTVVTIARV